jgi:hypothetical protein
MKRWFFLFFSLTAIFVGTGAKAQELIESYVAVIGREDLFNSRGERLTQPWQILRQDRANYHQFRIRHRGDTGDSFFSDIRNRALMERMVMNGRINARAADTLVNGYSQAVLVKIFGFGSRGTYVDVTIFE